MKIIGEKNVKLDSSFAEEIRRRSGENVFLCYQCKKCASGCPSRDFMAKTPTELMRYVQLGMFDEVMDENSVWYCLSCQTCSVRCPQDIDIAHVLDTIRIIAEERKLSKYGKSARLFNRLWMKMIGFTGRIYELGLIGMLNVLSLKPFKDLPLGIKMIKKGKLKLFPSIRLPFATRKMFSRAKRLSK